jgi:hypothetical protein
MTSCHNKAQYYKNSGFKKLRATNSKVLQQTQTVISKFHSSFKIKDEINKQRLWIIEINFLNLLKLIPLAYVDSEMMSAYTLQFFTK